ATRWSRARASFRYAQRAHGARGIRATVLKAGVDGKAAVRVRGRGTLLSGSSGPLALPLTVQLVDTTNDVCFEAVYGAASVQRNDATRFRGAARDARDDWPVSNHDHRNTRDNPAERALSARTVGGLVPRWRVDGLSGVTGTPAVVDGVVYFGDWSGVFHAVHTADGKEIWTRTLGQGINPAPLV